MTEQGSFHGGGPVLQDFLLKPGFIMLEGKRMRAVHAGRREEQPQKTIASVELQAMRLITCCHQNHSGPATIQPAKTKENSLTNHHRRAAMLWLYWETAVQIRTSL